MNSFKIGSMIFMAQDEIECQDWMIKIQEILNKKVKVSFDFFLEKIEKVDQFFSIIRIII